MTTAFLLYGSYGYTGSLVSELAVRRGMQPILAGRNHQRLKAQADALGLDYRLIPLDDRKALEAAHEEVSLVLNCAGPFQHTYQPIVEACLRVRRHYLDITGEIRVFEALAALDERARDAGVMLLPGMGMDVVPSDCLAAHLKRRSPEAIRLTLALSGTGGGFSRGTLKTSVEGISGQSLVRKAGKLVEVPLLEKIQLVDFGRGPRTLVNIPWGDVSTSFYSTGIKNIETYVVLPRRALRWVSILRPLVGLGRTRLVQWLLMQVVMRMPPGPSEKLRQKGRSKFWGEVTDERGNRCVSRLETMNGYSLTAETALAGIARILAGDYKPCFQTPALAYGADFILQFEGSQREDIV